MIAHNKLTFKKLAQLLNSITSYEEEDEETVVNKQQQEQLELDDEPAMLKSNLPSG